MQLKGFSFTQIFLYCMAGYLGMDFYSSLMLFVGDVSTPDVECHHWWEGKQGSTFEFKSYMFKNLFKVRCCSEAMWHRLYSAVYMSLANKFQGKKNNLQKPQSYNFTYLWDPASWGSLYPRKCLLRDFVEWSSYCLIISWFSCVDIYWRNSLY